MKTKKSISILLTLILSLSILCSSAIISFANHTHTFGNWTLVSEPSCTDAGQEKRVCSDCGQPEYRDIDPLDHDPGQWEIAQHPTCTKDGLELSICARCEKRASSKTIPAEGHKFGEWKTVKNATEKETGLKERTCSVCNEKETEVIAMSASSGKTEVKDNNKNNKKEDTPISSTTEANAEVSTSIQAVDKNDQLTTAPNNTTVENENNNDSKAGYIIAAVIGVAVIGAVAVIVIKKRTK
jgi:hypothetical protein